MVPGGFRQAAATTVATGDTDVRAAALTDLNGDDGQPNLFFANSGAGNNSVRVDAGGRVGVRTATPDAGAALHVAGNLTVRGDVLVAPGVKRGFVQKRDFRRRIASVSFERPFAGDYAILLTASARKASRIFRPTVLRKTAQGFTFTCGGNPRYLRGVQWVTRMVGEY